MKKHIQEEKQPVVVATAIQTAFGGLNETWAGLMAGESALEPLPIDGIDTVYPVGRIKKLEGSLGSYERLHNLLHIGLSNISCFPQIADRSDIIVATTKGAADELLNNQDTYNGQPWQLASMIAEMTGCSGKTQTISAACASGTVALIQAGKRIKAGLSEFVIVVGIDLLSTFVVTGFDALKGLSPNPCRPYDKNRDGLSLGEGMGVMIVTSMKAARQNNLTPLARLSGWGVSCDATHITAPCRQGSGLQRVLAQATGNGNIPVGAVHAHGTGTIYNDAMEITAFQNFWPDPPPIHSIKGAIGHCLGAAGVIEAGISIKSLKNKVIPPTVGLKQPENKNIKVSGSEPYSITQPSILSCNSGFGGINGGILFITPD